MHTYTTKTLPKSEVEIEVTLPFLDFEPHIKNAALKISEKVEISGFRKGKAPYDLVKNKVGEVAILEEAADLAVRKTYSDLVLKIAAEKKEAGEEFTPLGRPEITVTKLALGNDFVYKAKFSLLPKITLPGYKKIAAGTTKNKKAILVSEEEVKKTVDWILESRAPIITVSREARKGDVVEVDFETRLEGVKLENGDSKNHPLILGRGHYLPGFEDKLVGMSAGEEKNFKLTAPTDWFEKKLAGKEVDFKVKMNLVQEKQLPELTDEFAKGLGKFSSADDLRQNVKDGLTMEKESKEKQRIRVEIIQKVAEEAKVEIPEILLERELEKMLEELKRGVENMQMKWEDYLTQIKKNTDELRREWRSEAEKRVRIALSLKEIGKLEKIEPTEEEVNQEINRVLPSYGTPEKAAHEFDPADLRDYAKGIIRNEKVFEFLESL